MRSFVNPVNPAYCLNCFIAVSLYYSLCSMYIVTFFVTDFYAAIKYFARWLWSAASNDTAETDRRADGRTRPIAVPSLLTRFVMKKVYRRLNFNAIQLRKLDSNLSRFDIVVIENRLARLMDQGVVDSRMPPCSAEQYKHICRLSRIP